MSSALRKFVAETATNGPLHFTGNRPIYVKVIWLLAFLVSASYCTFKLYGAYSRFVSGEFTTTVKANELNFEFPDVFFCNENPISGSYSSTLSAEDYGVLKQYRRIVDESMANMTFMDVEERSDFYSMRLINTLPYQFLSDKMGNREVQMKIYYSFNGKEVANFTPFFSPDLLNCFALNFSEVELRLLQNPSSNVNLGMFLDLQLVPPFDNSTDKDMIQLPWEKIDLKPNNLDPNLGMDFAIPTGLQVLIAPNGHYPSEFSLAVSVGPGMMHQIKLTMQEIVYNQEQLPGKCEGNSNDLVDFVNPYTQKKQPFKYSQTVCFFREVARFSMLRFNCSMWRLPIPWEYRFLPACYNYTEVPRNDFYNSNTYLERHAILQNATETCANKIPCTKRSYTYLHSASSWPSEDDWTKYFRGFVKRNIKDKFAPGLSYLVNNASFQEVKDTLLQVKLSSAEYKSEVIQLSLSYTFDSLIADFGGLLGLFLGMSMMSIMEFVELLHDLVEEAVTQRKGKRSARDTQKG